MVDNITVNVGTDHAYECATDVIGREGEGNTSQIQINIPETLCGCSIYLDFEKPNGEKHRTPKLEVTDGVAYYEIEPYLLTNSGDITVQVVVLTESGGIWKSSVKKYKNQYSINAFEDVPENSDFLANAENLLAQLEQERAEGLAEYDQKFTEVLEQFDQELTELAEMIANDEGFVDKVSGIYGDTLAQNAEDIAKNAEDIAKNTEDIATINDLLIKIAPYSLVEPDENGDYVLEEGKTYKVFFDRDLLDANDAYAFLKATYYNRSDEQITATGKITAPSFSWANYFEITINSISVYDAGGWGTDYFRVGYSINGTDYAWTVVTASYSEGTLSDFEPDEPTEAYLTGLTKCLLKNEEPYLR